jgi:hypothetical protein
VPSEKLPIQHGIPSKKISYFIGRIDVLAKMHDCLSASGDELFPRAVVLQGMGGIGKTQLALRYCEQVQKHYDFIFWANADTRSALNTSFSSFARTLGLEAHHSKTYHNNAYQNRGETSVELVKERLKDHRFLLILDSLDDPGEISDIQSYFPYSKNGSIVITRYGYS